jgi:hypothetical protein
MVSVIANMVIPLGEIHSSEGLPTGTNEELIEIWARDGSVAFIGTYAALVEMGRQVLTRCQVWAMANGRHDWAIDIDPENITDGSSHAKD